MTETRALRLPFSGFVGCLLFGGVATALAQQPFIPTAPAVAASPAPTPASFPFRLAQIALDENGVHSVYSLRATAPIASREVSQKIRLIIEDTTPQGTTTRQLSLNTGRRNSVAQLCAELRDIFRKYMAVRSSAVGSEVGKIGEIKYGGEIHFVVDSADYLRYDQQTAGEENRSTKLGANDVSNLIALLGEATRGKAR